MFPNVFIWPISSLEIYLLNLLGFFLNSCGKSSLIISALFGIILSTLAGKWIIEGKYLSIFDFAGAGTSIGLSNIWLHIDKNESGL